MYVKYSLSSFTYCIGFYKRNTERAAQPRDYPSGLAARSYRARMHFTVFLIFLSIRLQATCKCYRDDKTTKVWQIHLGQLDTL
jgi:hypothetical protein